MAYTSNDAYLVKSIISPDAQIVKGYGARIMSAAIASHNVAGNPDDVRALVACISSQSDQITFAVKADGSFRGFSRIMPDERGGDTRALASAWPMTHRLTHSE